MSAISATEFLVFERVRLLKGSNVIVPYLLQILLGVSLTRGKFPVVFLVTSRVIKRQK